MRPFLVPSIDETTMMLSIIEEESARRGLFFFSFVVSAFECPCLILCFPRFATAFRLSRRFASSQDARASSASVHLAEYACFPLQRQPIGVQLSHCG